MRDRGFKQEFLRPESPDINLQGSVRGAAEIVLAVRELCLIPWERLGLPDVTASLQSDAE